MSTITEELVMEIMPTRVEISPATGRLRLKESCNDVMWVLETLGGAERSAEILGVEVAEVHRWIDEHYVPSPYAEKLYGLTGTFVESIQEPCVGIRIGEACWPKSYRLHLARQELLDS